MKKDGRNISISIIFYLLALSPVGYLAHQMEHFQNVILIDLDGAPPCIENYRRGFATTLQILMSGV